VLAASAIQTNQNRDGGGVLIPRIARGCDLDTLLAMSRRAVRGRPLFAPTRNTSHHRLLAVGFRPAACWCCMPVRGGGRAGVLLTTPQRQAAPSSVWGAVHFCPALAGLKIS